MCRWAGKINRSEGGTYIDGEIEEVELDGLVSAKGLAAANCDRRRLRGRGSALQNVWGVWGQDRGASRTACWGIADKMQTQRAQSRACHSRRSTSHHGCSIPCGGSTAGSLRPEARAGSMLWGEIHVLKPRVGGHRAGLLTVGKEGVADLASGASNADSDGSLLLGGGAG